MLRHHQWLWVAAVVSSCYACLQTNKLMFSDRICWHSHSRQVGLQVPVLLQEPVHYGLMPTLQLPEVLGGKVQLPVPCR
jgi:hypothetical protein